MSVSLSSNVRVISLRLKVMMCDRAAVALFVERFGGYFADGKKRAFPKSGRPIFEWGLNAGKCLPAIHALRGKCKIKARLLELALPMAVDMAASPPYVSIGQTSRELRLAKAVEIAKINFINEGGRRYRALLDDSAVADYLEVRKPSNSRPVEVEGLGRFASIVEASTAVGVSIAACHRSLVKGWRIRGRAIWDSPNTESPAA